jgi:hypothetical protein
MTNYREQRIGYRLSECCKADLWGYGYPHRGHMCSECGRKVERGDVIRVDHMKPIGPTLGFPKQMLGLGNEPAEAREGDDV